MPEFVLDLATLPPGRSQVDLESSPGDIGLPAAEWPWPVRAELAVEINGELVSVSGRLLAVAELECVRCLRAFELPLKCLFEVYAQRSGSGRNASDEDDLVRDRLMLFHDGRRLDLCEEARQTLLLEIPMAPSCRVGCRGLCTRCGADLNQGPCDCPS